MNNVTIIKEENNKSAFDLEPDFDLIDSMQVLFFDDPYGDSIRYTRFFSYVNSNEMDLIKKMKDQLYEPYMIKTSRDTCRSEGKIYLLSKGEPLKTIYFSTYLPSCSYTYFIKDGSFYYFEITERFRDKISSLKKRAKRN
jgi:hypothetical protein